MQCHFSAFSLLKAEDSATRKHTGSRFPVPGWQKESVGLYLCRTIPRCRFEQREMRGGISAGSSGIWNSSNEDDIIRSSSDAVPADGCQAEALPVRLIAIAETPCIPSRENVHIVRRECCIEYRIVGAYWISIVFSAIIFKSHRDSANVDFGAFIANTRVTADDAFCVLFRIISATCGEQ